MNKALQKIKNSTAALDPAMELAKEEADDKFEEFEKIAVNMNGELGAKKQPTPSKPKWSLDESLFDKPALLIEGAALDQNEIRTFANSAGAERRPLQSEDVQDLDTCSFETSYDLLDYASDIANQELTSKEELQNYLDNQDYSDGSEIMYYVVFDGEVLIDDTDYFEVEMWNDVVDEFDESLGVTNSEEIKARKDVADYFQAMLEQELLDDPIQAQELDFDLDSYNADWCPEEFNSQINAKFEKVKSLINQLAIALADTYFDDNLMESLKESIDEIKIPAPYDKRFMISDYEDEFADYQPGDEIDGYGCHLLAYLQPIDEEDEVYPILTDDPDYPVCELVRDRLIPVDMEDNELSESLNESLSFINNIDKDILNQASVDPEDCKEFITSNIIKSPKSAIHNLMKLLNDGKSATLHLGNFSIEDDDTSDTISHVWVESDGKIYQTRVPSDKVKLHSVKEIEFTPDDVSNVKSILESNLKGN